MTRITDTLTGARHDLRPLAPDGVVRLYVCGVTPYSESHVGHALHAIVFDVLRRYLEWRGFKVRHVQNFTDIDDKLIDRANRLGVPMEELAQENIEAYLRQLKAMNVMPATVYPRVTEMVPQIIAFISGLIEKGFAYPSGGDVYFRVRKKADYGKLSHRNIDDLRSGARVDPTELKDDPLDFALWKGAKPGEPAWESPWGPGRPGWHIECSVMARETLGDQIDIHGGGADLIFPHHENEIAQTEAFTGRPPFAATWMHNALLQLGTEKMSKSLGNLVTIDEALARYGSDALRLFVLGSHYRSPSTYSDEALEAAKTGAERLREAAFANCPVPPGTPPDSTESSAPHPAGPRQLLDWTRFDLAMDDDLNTPRALAVLFDHARAINRLKDSVDIRPAQEEFRRRCEVLGLTLESPPAGAQEAAPFIDLLVAVRSELRAAKQWALSDRIRDGLAGLGVELKDGPEGTTWSA